MTPATQTLPPRTQRMMMATVEVPTPPPTVVDLDGVSTALSTPVSADTDEPGRGAAYGSSALAAGRLFHVHRAGTAFLCSFSTRWTAATPAANSPGNFSAKTVNSRPSFWWMNPQRSGAIGATSSPGEEVGALYPQGDGTLRITSATSINSVLVYLGRHGGGNFLAPYRVDQGVVQSLGSQWLTPAINGDFAEMAWDRCVFGYPGTLVLVGSTPSNVLYMMKTTLRKPLEKSALGGLGQSYLGEKGWELNPGEAKPLTTAAGTPITSVGAVSMVRYREQWVMSTVVDGGSNWEARFFRAVHPSRPWSALTPPTPVVLGPKSVDPMLCGAFFQDSVTVNPAHADANPALYRGGLPYTYTVESATALATKWGVLPVPLGAL